MVNSTVVGNKALPSETPEMLDLLKRGERYAPLPSAGVEMPDTVEQLGELTPYEFITDVDEGHGGGIAVDLTAVRHRTIAEIIFQNLEVTDNEAYVGGRPMRCSLPRRILCSQVASRFTWQDVTGSTTREPRAFPQSTDWTPARSSDCTTSR